MISIALVGAGFIGNVHGKNLALNPEVKFAGIYDCASNRAAELAEKYGTKCFTDYQDILDDRSIDALVIGSSTPTHADFLTRAARAGKAIFCEKPIDLSLDIAIKAVEACNATNARVMMDFNRRYDAGYAELKRAVSNGEIGEPQIISLVSRGPNLPDIEYLKVSGGQMRDQTVHFFDLARWLLNKEPLEVAVMGSALVDPRVAEIGDVDTSIAALKFDGGAICHIDSAREIAYGYDESIEISGTKGKIAANPVRIRNVSRYLPGIVCSDGLHEGWFERMEPTYQQSLAAFVSAMNADDFSSVPTLADGIAAQKIAEAATRALNNKTIEKIETL